MENMPSLPGRWESAPLPLTTATSFVVQHGRGTPPRQVRWVLVCVAADNGYVPGDELLANGNQNNVSPATPWSNAVQIGLALAGMNFSGLTFGLKAGGGTFSPTVAKWTIKCYADF